MIWFYRNYGNDKSLWSKVLLNYITIIFILFRFTSGFLFILTLADLYYKIIDFAKIYQWKGVVLPLALNVNTQIVKDHFSDFFYWKILVKWQAFFCKLMITKDTSTCKSVFMLSKTSSCENNFYYKKIQIILWFFV